MKPTKRLIRVISRAAENGRLHVRKLKKTLCGELGGESYGY